MSLIKHLLVALAALWLIQGCRGSIGMICEDPTRYVDSGEIPPLRVPDDLSTPDQSESLRIPSSIEGEAEQIESRGPCIESPPDFYEAGAPG